MSFTSNLQTRAPGIYTIQSWSAATSGTNTDVDVRGASLASIQITATVTSAGNSAAKVQGSNDGANWADISGATATVTGTNASFLIRLGTIDYAYLRLVLGDPSAGTLTGSALLYVKPTYTEQA